MTGAFLPQEIVRRKRDGAVLGEDEIAAFVKGFTDGGVTESQIAAFAMAIFFRGMSHAETATLTRAMAQSGRTLAWADLALPGPVLDKHSTGGVGDKVSLMLAPIVAACGGFVPMLSGRGLGHTGGTLRQAREHPRLPHRARDRRIPRGRPQRRLRHHRPDRRSRARRPPPLCRPRRHRDDRVDPADHRLDPLEEARCRARRPRHGREVGLRRLHDARKRARASSLPASSRSRARPGCRPSPC